MPPPGRRLRSLLAHLRAAEPDPSAAPSGSAAVARAPPKLLDDAAVKSFIMKGWMSLSPEEIGVTREFTQQVYDKMSALHDDKEKKIGCVASPAVLPCLLRSLRVVRPGRTLTAPCLRSTR